MSDPGHEEETGEKCVRCGDVGEDRRTLWMACFYAMQELHVPFEQVMLRGTRHKYLGEKVIRPAATREDGAVFPEFSVPEYDETPTSAEPKDNAFYTLRVCKDCRSDWMATIKKWFNDPPTVRTSCGSGIWIRENGATKEITHEEWDRRLKEAAKRKPAK